MRDIMAKVNMTRYSCFCGCHSGDSSLADSISLGSWRGDFSLEMENVDVGVKGSLEAATVVSIGNFSDMLEGFRGDTERDDRKAGSVRGSCVERRQNDKEVLQRQVIVCKVRVLPAYISL